MSTSIKEFKPGFNIRKNTCKTRINCSQYITMYYDFIKKNPLKYNQDFINEFGKCNLYGCELPSER